MQLTGELQRWFHEQDDLDGVALLPGLNEEARLGYDVSIPRRWGMLYLQFKMPKYLRRSNASEYAAFGEPYFRFPVKTDATLNGKVQHNVLCELEESGAAVFYASPCFLKSSELKDFARNDGMYSNSVFPRPLDMGVVPVNSRHSFAYTGIHDVRACSEPGPKFSASAELLHRKLVAVVRGAELMSLEQFLSTSLVKLMDKIGSTDLDGESVASLLASESNSIGLQAFIVRSGSD